MNDQTCKSCVHFRQHYVLDEQRGMAVGCGHCVYPRIKHRKPDGTACVHFEMRMEPLDLPDREQVVSFLTTEVLQHILDLKLPPEIEQELVT